MILAMRRAPTPFRHHTTMKVYNAITCEQISANQPRETRKTYQRGDGYTRLSELLDDTYETTLAATNQLQIFVGRPCAVQKLPISTLPSLIHLMSMTAPNAWIRSAKNNES